MATKKNEARGIVRQGDCLCVPIEMPEQSKLAPVPKDGKEGVFIVAGEQSGHEHRVFGRGSKLFSFRDTSTAARVLVVGRSGANLRVIGGGSGGVDRHEPIALRPGGYEVRIQRSWTSEDEAKSRQVAD